MENGYAAGRRLEEEVKMKVKVGGGYDNGTYNSNDNAVLLLAREDLLCSIPSFKAKKMFRGKVYLSVDLL